MVSNTRPGRNLEIARWCSCWSPANFDRAFSHNVGDADNLTQRIGIHSGPVIAGVIGKRKFSYDLWGETLNVASRMESEGIPGKIQISDETRKLLPIGYFVAVRGEVQFKGHLPRTIYFLEGRS